MFLSQKKSAFVATDVNDLFVPVFNVANKSSRGFEAENFLKFSAACKSSGYGCLRKRNQPAEAFFLRFEIFRKTY